MKKRILNKIKCTRGETITETLVSLIIIVLAMAMLAGSIVAAANVNNKIKNANTAFNTSDAASDSGTAYIVHHITDKQDSVSVKVYTTNDSNSYVYYEREDTTTQETTVTP